MKKKIAFFIVGLLSIPALCLQAQEESSWSTGLDLYNTYVFRGTALSGPSLQPSIEFNSGNFTIGAWGSQGFHNYQEMDIYTSYSFDFGLSVGLTDYYYPGYDYFNFDKENGGHAFEVNLGYSIGALSLAGNYIINEAGGAGSLGGDMYYEAGLDVGKVNLFVGAGDGVNTSDGDFNVCNFGLGTSKEIKISDSSSIPVSGSLVWNPEREKFYIVVGISL